MLWACLLLFVWLPDVTATCSVSNLALTSGQETDPSVSGTVADGTSVTISCDSDHVSSGFAFAGPYVCSGSSWTQTGVIGASSVVCTKKCESVVQFDAGYGGCVTYDKSSGTNYNYCGVDSDSNGNLASNVCVECEQCTTSSTDTGGSDRTVVIAAASAREGASTSMAFGGCSCRTDSSLNCGSQGVCEIDPSSDSRCGYNSLSYSTPVTWDMCALSSHNACIDRVFTWVDSQGLSCRDYGINYCQTRSNKVSSDNVGITNGGAFTNYANSGFDASQICCMCGGGTQKCLEEDMPPTSRVPWKYDYSACNGVQVGSSCAVTCLGDSASTAVSCQRESVLGYDSDAPWETQAVLADFPDCPESYDGWGLKGTGKCTGTVGRTSVSTWKSCVAGASSDCNVALSWDANTNTCYEYPFGQCDTIDAIDGYYTFEFIGPTPVFAPVISSVSTTTNRGNTHISAYVIDNHNCNIATVEYTWYYQLEWTDGTTTSSDSVVASVTASNMYVTMMTNPESGQSWSVKAAAYTVHAGDNSQSDLGPWSESYPFTT